MVTTVNGSDLDDSITLSGDTAYEANGMGGDDTFVTTAGNFGAATITGGTGDDVISLSTGNLLAYGNQGADNIRLNHGDADVYGGQGNDNITAGTGSGLLAGNKGDDFITVTQWAGTIAAVPVTT